jgi:acyl carrier protein
LALEPDLIMTIMSSSIEKISGPTRASDSVVRALIARHLDVDIGRVTDDASFIDDLGADWLDRLELMIMIEDHFPGLEIPEDDADRMQVVGDLIRYIESWRQTPAATTGPRSAQHRERQMVMTLKYGVTEDFVAAHGWTPDKTAQALRKSLASVSVLVERVRSLEMGVFSPQGCSPIPSRRAEVIRIVGQVLDGKWREGSAADGLSFSPGRNGDTFS